MKNKQAHKRILNLLMAVLLFISCVFAIVLGGCITAKDDEAETIDSIQGSGVKCTAREIATDEYAEYGISPQSESAYTVTATVMDAEGNSPAELQLVDFALSWADGGEYYGEDPDYYDNGWVSMTVDGTSCTVECLQAFEVQIILTCTSQVDPTKKVTVTFDYAKRLDTLLIDCFGNGNQTVSNGDTVDVNFPLFTGSTPLSSRTELTENWLSLNAYNYGSGTVGGKDLSYVNVYIGPTNTFQSALRKTSTYSGSAVISSIIEKKTGSSMYGQLYSLYTLLIEILPKLNAPNYMGANKVYREEFLSALKETTEHLEVRLQVANSITTSVITFKINFIYEG